MQGSDDVTRTLFLSPHFSWCWLLCEDSHTPRMAAAVPDPTFSLIHFPEGKMDGVFPGLLAKDSLLWLGHWLIFRPITMVRGEDIAWWWLMPSICICFVPEVHGLGVTKHIHDKYPPTTIAMDWELFIRHYLIFSPQPLIHPSIHSEDICWGPTVMSKNTWSLTV